jgi:hypothetical protein
MSALERVALLFDARRMLATANLRQLLLQILERDRKFVLNNRGKAKIVGHQSSLMSSSMAFVDLSTSSTTRVGRSKMSNGLQ